VWFVTKVITDDVFCRNDPRYVNAWIDMLLIYHNDSAHASFRYMQSEGIGTKCAVLYIAWAENFEKYANFSKADQVFQLGFKNNAEPTEVLQAAHQ